MGGQQSTTDTFNGFTHGILGLVGAGEVYDPLGDLRSKLATANSNLQQVTNSQSLLFATEEGTVNKDIWKYIMTNNAKTTQYINANNEVALDNIEQTDIVLAIIWITVFIIVIYLISLPVPV